MPEAQLWGGPNDPSRSPSRSDEGCGGGTHCLGGPDKSWVSLGGTKLNVASATSGLILSMLAGAREGDGHPQSELMLALEISWGGEVTSES